MTYIILGWTISVLIFFGLSYLAGRINERRRDKHE